MSFGWLGTFRQGQWQLYRSFVLNERRDVDKRLSVIEAELTRIGEVTVYFGSSTDGSTKTEERKGFSVSPNTTLCKLLMAYTAQGGNPLDISLFLSPDCVVQVDSADDTSVINLQPYGGVVYPKSDSYAIGKTYEGGYLCVKKYLPPRVGGRKVLEDGTVAAAVDLSRRWVNQVIQERIHDMEARIIKQCDLREQLKYEHEQLMMAIGGTHSAIPTLDQDQYTVDLGVTKLVAAIDAVFYPMDTTGVIPDFTKINTGDVRDSYMFLMDDILPDELNTGL